MMKLLLAITLCLAPHATLRAADTPVTLTPPSAAKALSGKRVMTLGDSVTQDGRYVSFIEYYLQKQNPTLDFDFINAGLASETTSGLTEEGHPGPRP